MDTNQDLNPAHFANVSPFTGEPENYPTGISLPPVPLMRSQTQFHTAVAVQRPRNLDKVVAAVLREAEFAGDAFYYSFPMGGKKLEGPSIGLAMAVAREWSNCAVPVEYYETATEWVICKQGETGPGLATVTLQRGESTIIFKQVPAEVCSNCGEYSAVSGLVFAKKDSRYM